MVRPKRDGPPAPGPDVLDDTGLLERGQRLPHPRDVHTRTTSQLRQRDRMTGAYEHPQEPDVRLRAEYVFERGLQRAMRCRRAPRRHRGTPRIEKLYVNHIS